MLMGRLPVAAMCFAIFVNVQCVTLKSVPVDAPLKSVPVDAPLKSVPVDRPNVTVEARNVKSGAIDAHKKGLRKIACIGDSITFGKGSRNLSYPEHLQLLLGDGYKVLNYGHSSKRMLKKFEGAYWKTREFQEAKHSHPDIAIIMLGTNDADKVVADAELRRVDNGKATRRPQLEQGVKPPKAGEASVLAEFEDDYMDMIKVFQNVGARVFVVSPPPDFTQPSAGKERVRSAAWRNKDLRKIVARIARSTGATFIDVHSAWLHHCPKPGLGTNHCDLIDGETASRLENYVHPNDMGYQLTAEHIYRMLHH